MYYVFCLALSNVIFPRITGDTVERVFTPNGGLDNQVIGIKTFFCSINIERQGFDAPSSNTDDEASSTTRNSSNRLHHVPWKDRNASSSDQVSHRP